MIRVAVLELPASWGRPDRVLEEVDGLLAEGPEADLVVLPEAALTGYVSPRGIFDPSGLAEPAGGPLERAAAEIASRRGVHLAVPVARREGSAVFNAVVLLDPRGRRVATYDKRHPWIPETWATRGRAPPPLVTIAGAVVTFAICFDVHFLADDAAGELSAADVLVFPSAWVDDEDTRVPLLRALAARFDVAIASANWAPGDVRLPGQGGSCIVDRRGDVVAEVASGGRRVDARL